MFVLLSLTYLFHLAQYSQGFISIVGYVRISLLFKGEYHLFVCIHHVLLDNACFEFGL